MLKDAYTFLSMRVHGLTMCMPESRLDKNLVFYYFNHFFYMLFDLFDYD